jgi:ankyrin repeat protein
LIACQNGHIDIVELLIDKGANVNIKNYKGRTGLFVVCLEGRIGLVKLLIDKGVDVNIKDNDDGLT